MHFPGIISFTYHKCAGLPTSLQCAALLPCFSHHTVLLEPERPHRKPFLFSLQVAKIIHQQMGGISSFLKLPHL